MKTLILRDYQRRSLDALERFLTRAQVMGAEAAFQQTSGRTYRHVPALPALPYVCLRVPTGGGKTLMAAHAVGPAAKAFLGVDRVVCLWLVPSNTIREQTLARLRDVADPYRQALDEAFEGRVTVMNLDEALYVDRATLDGDTCVIVATLAAFRVEDTEGRRVYEQNGALTHHFTGLPAAATAGLDLGADGRPVESLANVLRLRRPVVIVDEAHNARTPLSFETLARLGPSCVIEFTATPALQPDPTTGNPASNVLAHVSAAELKAEDMIKLPVRLRTFSAWKEAVAAALAKQRELEAAAAAERAATGEYLRPIVLFQAQSRHQSDHRITVDVLKEALLNDFHVPADQIAVETGATRELEGVDLTDEQCRVRFVITVQALREGWDAPFAYVLCSVADMASASAVEQLLGRVLRLPRAVRKRDDALNCAYAYATSPDLALAAAGLRDALIENGFQRIEAAEFLRRDSGDQERLFADGLFAHTSRQVTRAPDLSAITAEFRDQVSFNPATNTLTVAGEMSPALKQELERAFDTPEDRGRVDEMFRASRGMASAPDAGARERPPAIVLPRLAVRVNGELELFSEAHFLGRRWRLGTADAHLSEQEFALESSAGDAGVIDVSDVGKLEIKFRDDAANQLSLLQGEPGWDIPTLAVWIDRQFPHPDLTQEDVSLFVHRALTYLTSERAMTVEQLARHKFRLAKAIAAKVDAYRAAHNAASYQTALFGDGAGAIEVSPTLALRLDDKAVYAPSRYYEGPVRFERHFFGVPGDLDAEGEEFQCAVYLERHAKVASWVRNIANRPDSSFSLPTSTDRFYPDFVGLLTDGRVFAVESKGADRWSNDDSKEKRAVGELWAARSGGACVFVMPKGTDWSAIDAAFNTAPPAGFTRAAS